MERFFETIAHHGVRAIGDHFLLDNAGGSKPASHVARFDESDLQNEDIIAIQNIGGSFKRVWRVWKTTSGNVVLDGRIVCPPQSVADARAQAEAIHRFIDKNTSARYTFSKGKYDGWKDSIRAEEQSSASWNISLEKMRALLGLLLYHSSRKILTRLIINQRGEVIVKLWKGGDTWELDGVFGGWTGCVEQQYPLREEDSGKIFVTKSGYSAVQHAAERCR